MNELKMKLPEGETHYLVGDGTFPLIDLLVFENSITVQEHTHNVEGRYAYRLFLDKAESTDKILRFTTRNPGILSYFLYQIDIMIDLSGDIPIFALCAGIPIFGIFNETYILRVRL